MNVGDSVKHAIDELDRRKWDAAMLHACNAVDGTGRKRYPKLGVAARFKRTIRDSIDIFGMVATPGLNVKQTRFPAAVRSDLPDKRPDIADVIYGIHRCAHGHGDELPAGYELTPTEDGMADLWAARGVRVQLPSSVVSGLLSIVVFAPENKGQVIPATYQLSITDRTFFINSWWGREDDVRELVKVDQFPPGITVDFADWWDDWKPRR